MPDYLTRGDRRERYLAEDEGDLHLHQFFSRPEKAPPHFTLRDILRHRLAVALHEIGEPPFLAADRLQFKIAHWAHSRTIERSMGIGAHRTEVGVLWDNPDISTIVDEGELRRAIAKTIVPADMRGSLCPTILPVREDA
jgi:hypothetical protein